ncbi:hypothetical protein EJ110_NYTH06015 [Nymphaea thermarum]|nr:hypothetical protein EJ110_NYTH06015 [Nymphaea thermarum]
MKSFGFGFDPNPDPNVPGRTSTWHCDLGTSWLEVLSPRAQELDIVEASRAGLGGPLAHQGQSSKVESRLRCDPMEMGGHEETANRREALLPTPAPSSGKSWASIVDGGRLQANMDMPPLEKKEMDGKRRLTISQQSYEVLCQPFRFSAIATLAGGAGKGRLDYSFIFTSLKTLWPEIADLRFTSVGKGLFLLRTSSEADLHLILSPGRWYVGGRLLIANQWHPGMPMRIESSNKVRIWIRLPDLPVEWWNPRIFTDIAELIGTTNGSGHLPQLIASGPTVTAEENDELLSPVIDNEINWAVMDAERDSAPGPDGFGNSFFQSNWSVVQEAVTRAIRGFFESGRLVKSINRTHIVLLPKEQGAS